MLASLSGKAHATPVQWPDASSNAVVTTWNMDTLRKILTTNRACLGRKPSNAHPNPSVAEFNGTSSRVGAVFEMQGTTE
jgi:hypothetical protein